MVDDSSVSASWSSSSPDMVFSFPLQRPIFCPKKTNKQTSKLWRKPTISYVKKQRQQLKNLLRNMSEPGASNRAHSSSTPSWAGHPVPTQLELCIQHPELEALLNPAPSLLLALCISHAEMGNIEIATLWTLVESMIPLIPSVSCEDLALRFYHFWS